MVSFSSILRVILLSAALLFPNEWQSSAFGYVLPFSHRTRQIPSPSRKLYSSPNILTGSISTSKSDDDRNDDDDDKNYDSELNNKKSQKPIQFSNFWGTKYATEDDNDSTDPRKVPFSSSLDPHDGPLPPGAYVTEGRPEFDSKPTCRITIAVRSGNTNARIVDDPDEVVKRLQTCVDAGLDTFQLHDQTPRSLDIIRRMNEDTPSYVQKHWSIRLKVASTMASLPDDSGSNGSTTKSDLRHSILDLVEQTGSDALDSLQVDCGGALHDGTTLETFEHLIDLQREGWIRSIGLRGMESSPRKLQRDIIAYFGDHIDFEQQEGSLLVPPAFSSSSGGLLIPEKNTNTNMRMANALAGGLLTDIYNSDDYRRGGKTGKNAYANSSRNNNNNNNNNAKQQQQQHFLTNENTKVLNQWVSRREGQRQRESTTSSSNSLIWKQYQEHVVEQMSWIAMKHDVSMTAVALRWALEFGATNKNNKTGQATPIISSALADVVFDDPNTSDVPFRKPTDLRQVFRFRLDEEDKTMLSEITATPAASEQDDRWSGDDDEDQDGDDYPDIEFNNPKFWL
mmetsp:Transcript_5420/g.11200  ORF Transcript_5420/g.11200 Transcript_5420/m.11200 type:complete len:567 (+) Transcript_5420:98-1798(+)